MPRGVPKTGFRRTKNWRARQAAGGNMSIPHDRNPLRGIQPAPELHIKDETDEEINERISERFDILQSLVDSSINGDCRALIVSGPAGLGKSFTVEETLMKWDRHEDNHTIVKGYVRPTGLFKLLYQHREAGKVIVFDDADSIFFDDISLNMLKAVCDTTDRRRVSYLAETNLVDEESADVIPRTFEFDGTIIFITNYDFDEMIGRGHKLAPHLAALVSRSYYIDLSMKTTRDYMIRIKQVANGALFDRMGLTVAQKHDVMKFIETNKDFLRELSLRIAIKIAGIRKSNPADWERIAKVTACKNR